VIPEAVATISYTAEGAYTVTLTVSGPGGSETEIKTAYIKVGCCVVYHLPLIMKD